MYNEKIKNSVAVMQPYAFPFIGYFQLINSVDHFVFYDDVNFIKKGWINRNRIIINKNDFQFTISLHKISQFKKIKEIKVLSDNKLLKNIQQEYKKAPYFDEVYPLLKNILDFEYDSIAHLAGTTVIEVSNYLNIKTKFYYSSSLSPETVNHDRADRLISITKNFNVSHYINSIGGKVLYDKTYFKKNGVKLSFLQPTITPYEQNTAEFIPGLSIIDVLMNNSKEKIIRELLTYNLE